MTLTIDAISSLPAHKIPSDAARSYMHTLAALVAEIYVMFSQIAQNERKETSQLEQKFTLANRQVASSIRSQGSLAGWSGCASVVASLAALAWANHTDQSAVQKLSEGFVSGGTQLLLKGHEANSTNHSASAQIFSQKMQEKMNRQQDGNVKEPFAQVLQAEMQRLRSASASSN